MIIKKMYLIHNWFYEKKELVPSEHYDGKDELTERYVLLHEDVQDINAYEVPYVAKTLKEAQEELKYSFDSKA
ncbi:MAG: hypothetical protein ACQEWW_23010 [Bacillota bacterium]